MAIYFYEQIMKRAMVRLHVIMICIGTSQVGVVAVEAVMRMSFTNKAAEIAVEVCDAAGCASIYTIQTGGVSKPIALQKNTKVKVTVTDKGVTKPLFFDLGSVQKYRNYPVEYYVINKSGKLVLEAQVPEGLFN